MMKPLCRKFPLQALNDGILCKNPMENPKEGVEILKQVEQLNCDYHKIVQRFLIEIIALTLSTEKDRNLTVQEHRHLLKILFAYELQLSQVETKNRNGFQTTRKILNILIL